MSVTAADVKALRDRTGAAMMDAKSALVEAEGDVDRAVELLRVKGQASAAKREGRGTNEGVVASYIHANDKVGAMVEVQCETDFVARNEIFTALVKDVAMHVAASAPLYVSSDDIPAQERERVATEFNEKAIADGKPADMVEKITAGQISKYFAERCLLDQPFIKNPDMTVGDYVKDHNARLGENIVVRRFSRLALGEK